LSHFNNRAEVVVAKSKVYSDEFINWFGDWVNNSANASKVVDENGEPLVVWHTGNAGIKKFRDFVIGGYNTDEEPILIPNGIYTTDNK